jgi:hypothetical protein
MEITEEAILKRIPPNHLILDQIVEGKTNSVLTKVSESVSKMKRRQGPLHQNVAIYIRPHQLSTMLGDRMIADFRTLDRVWKVTYDHEQITNDIWGYRMQIYVN